MNKSFIFRLILFIIVSVGVPIAYLIYKFDMFQQSTKLGLAEMLCVIIVIAMGVVLLKFYLAGMKTKYSYLKQIIMGLIKVIIPLAISLFVLLWLGDNIVILEEFMIIVIPCEILAILVNPLPKWAFDNNIDGLTGIIDKVVNKGDKK